jgi:hypothetical protein
MFFELGIAILSSSLKKSSGFVLTSLKQAKTTSRSYKRVNKSPIEFQVAFKSELPFSGSSYFERSTKSFVLISLKSIL